MVSTLHVPLDDETYDQLSDEKDRRGLTWEQFLEEVANQMQEAEA